MLHGEEMQGYCAEIARLGASRQAGLLSAVRQFSIYLHALEPQSAILPLHILPRHSRAIRFHPLSEAEIGRLMKAAETLSPRNGIRPHCIRFLVGLLYCAGLRITEALALNLGDVDAENATLFVRCGKFRKERLVPMSHSTLNAMAAWLDRRGCHAGSEPSTPLFIDRWNKRLGRDQAAGAFRRLCASCGIGDRPRPRLHDLRHNYACRRLALWREEREDIDAMIPVLANAMGHVNIFSTQVYIHIDAASLHQASAKFNAHIAHSREDSK
jgi:integrase